jgi:hypothetical protein
VEETRSRAFLAFCEAVFVFLPWFFHWGLLLRMEIPGLPERVLSEVQHRCLGALFPRAWLWCLALLWFCCLEILFPLVWFSRALLWPAGSQGHPRARAATP